MFEVPVGDTKKKQGEKENLIYRFAQSVSWSHVITYEQSSSKYACYLCLIICEAANLF